MITSEEGVCIPPHRVRSDWVTKGDPGAGPMLRKKGGFAAGRVKTHVSAVATPEGPNWKLFGLTSSLLSSPIHLYPACYLKIYFTFHCTCSSSTDAREKLGWGWKCCCAEILNDSVWSWEQLYLRLDMSLLFSGSGGLVAKIFRNCSKF